MREQATVLVADTVSFRGLHGPGKDHGTTAGKVFIVSFLQNKNSADKIPTREVMITGIEPVTQVTFRIDKDNFKKVITVKKGETITFPYPVTTELKGSGFCRRPMVITADNPITVVSRNYRDDSGDTALIYPVSQWGFQYYITTPSEGPANEKTQFSITSQQNSATVVIYVTGVVILNQQQYNRGDKMTITLEPYTTLQIQSPDNLSGTKVDSNQPVQVMAGHTCAQGSERCSHVCDQLQDVENWGTTFFIPSMPYQLTYDIVYAIVSKDTTITYSTAKGKIDKSMKPGEQIQINVDQSSPLFITCKDGIQVLFLGRGGRYNNQPFGPFTSMIPSSETFGLSYSLFGQNGFDVNLAFIICKTVSISGITIDGVAPQGLQWKPFPGTEYSYAIYDIGRGFSTHTFQHPFATFGLLSFGYTKNIAYGSMAPCIRGNPYWWTWGRWLYYIFQRPVQHVWSKYEETKEPAGSYQEHKEVGPMYKIGVPATQTQRSKFSLKLHLTIMWHPKRDSHEPQEITSGSTGQHTRRNTGTADRQTLISGNLLKNSLQSSTKKRTAVFISGPLGGRQRGRFSTETNLPQ
ncbi:IgGFc-binding protein-like [Gastrophryne carolinensis]